MNDWIGPVLSALGKHIRDLEDEVSAYRKLIRELEEELWRVTGGAREPVSFDRTAVSRRGMAPDDERQGEGEGMA